MENIDKFKKKEEVFISIYRKDSIEYFQKIQEYFKKLQDEPTYSNEFLTFKEFIDEFDKLENEDLKFLISSIFCIFIEENRNEHKDRYSLKKEQDLVEIFMMCIRQKKFENIKPELIMNFIGEFVYIIEKLESKNEIEEFTLSFIKLAKIFEDIKDIKDLTESFTIFIREKIFQNTKPELIMNFIGEFVSIIEKSRNKEEIEEFVLSFIKLAKTLEGIEDIKITKKVIFDFNELLELSIKRWLDPLKFIKAKINAYISIAELFKDTSKKLSELVILIRDFSSRVLLKDIIELPEFRNFLKNKKEQDIETLERIMIKRIKIIEAETKAVKTITKSLIDIDVNKEIFRILISKFIKIIETLEKESDIEKMTDRFQKFIIEIKKGIDEGMDIAAILSYDFEKMDIEGIDIAAISSHLFREINIFAILYYNLLSYRSRILEDCIFKDFYTEEKDDDIYSYFFSVLKRQDDILKKNLLLKQKTIEKVREEFKSYPHLLNFFSQIISNIEEKGQLTKMSAEFVLDIARATNNIHEDMAFYLITNVFKEIKNFNYIVKDYIVNVAEITEILGDYNNNYDLIQLVSCLAKNDKLKETLEFITDITARLEKFRENKEAIEEINSAISKILKNQEISDINSIQATALLKEISDKTQGIESNLTLKRKFTSFVSLVNEKLGIESKDSKSRDRF